MPSEVKFEAIRKVRAYEGNRDVEPFLFRAELTFGTAGADRCQDARLLHESAGSDPRYQEALAHEAVICEGDSGASNLQPSRQLTCRREAPARLEPAFLDRRK